MNDMVDMSRFVEAKSDQLNADDLIGGPRTVTVTRVTGNDGDQPVSIHFQGDNGKPFKPCKTVRRVLLAAWGPYAPDYVGRSMTLFRDNKVTFGGLETGGIRISHMSHIDKEMTVVVLKTKGKKAGIKILPLRQAEGEGAMTLKTALADLEAAGTLDELKVAWTRKAMAPFRERLQGDLDRRRAELAEPPADSGPADDQRGDAFTADDLIGHINKKARRTDLDELMRSNADAIDSFDEADRARIEQAFNERAAALREQADG